MKNRLKKIIYSFSNHYFSFNEEEYWNSFYIYRKTIKREFSFNENYLPSDCIDKYKASIDWCLEFCYSYPNQCIIEPSLGYAIVNQRTLLKESLWHRYVHPRLSRPNATKYLFGRAFCSTLKLDKAIVLQYGASNYWHFYNDFIGALRLADELDIDLDIPVLVPEKLKEKEFFHQLLEVAPKLKDIKWVFQKSNEYYEVGQSYFLATAHAHRRNFNYAKSIIQITKDINAEDHTEKIFVTRSKKWDRTVSNLEEIHAICKDQGFTIVNCDYLSVEEQIRIFSQAKVCIGIHGAALTNIIFSNAGLSFLEILSNSRISPVYYLMAKHYKHSYNCLLGQQKDDRGNFYVEPSELYQKLHLLKEIKTFN